MPFDSQVVTNSFCAAMNSPVPGGPAINRRQSEFGLRGRVSISRSIPFLGMFLPRNPTAADHPVILFLRAEVDRGLTDGMRNQRGLSVAGEGVSFFELGHENDSVHTSEVEPPEHSLEQSLRPAPRRDLDVVVSQRFMWRDDYRHTAESGGGACDQRTHAPHVLKVDQIEAPDVSQQPDSQPRADSPCFGAERANSERGNRFSLTPARRRRSIAALNLRCLPGKLWSRFRRAARPGSRQSDR